MPRRDGKPVRRGIPVWKRFMSFVKVLSNGCWKWTGGTSDGYGLFWYQGRTVKANRFSYELFYEEKLPKDFGALHTCDYRRCVNPLHLFKGTRKDNTADMLLKGRGRSGLSWKKVCCIRKLFNTGDFSRKELGEKFGVSRRVAYDITVRKRWKTKPIIKKEGNEK